MMKYIDYIKVSGGGITVTGGEPVLQADFVAEVFRLAKEQGVHTALDTNGFADIEKVERLIKYTDLVLLDIKHAREDKHKIITGVSNEKIKRFALYLSDQGVPIWIRYVLVPGYTDDEDDLKMAADFIKKLKTVEKIEVLPYHNMGAYKWEKLGQKYMLEGVKGRVRKRWKKQRGFCQANNKSFFFYYLLFSITNLLCLSLGLVLMSFLMFLLYLSFI